MLQLYTFGGLRIEHDGQPLQLPTHKARDLLAYLITFRDRPHPRPVLVGILWPDQPEEKGRRRLSDTLWRVRRAAGPDVILADEDALAFNSAYDCWLDVERFESRMQEAAHKGQTNASRISLLASCIQLYRDPFLAGLYHDWVLLERERLHGLYLEALGRLLDLHKRGSDYESGLTIAQRIAAAEPLHEAAHRELIRFYHFLGRDAEAIAQYYRCREILREELNVAPAPETESLYHVLSRRIPPHVDVRVAHLPVPACRPGPGLDQLPLAGRDTERTALLSHLEAATAGQGGLVLLEGEPGIGKSRLAQELVAGARWRNIHTTTAAGDEAGASASYGLLLAALIPLLTPLRLRQLARTVEPHHFQAAAPLLPSIVDALPNRSTEGRPAEDGFLPSLPALPPSQARERLRQALVTLVLGLARIAPHLWVLEDLQWADAETLSLLPLLLPHVTESRTLLLLTGRSTELRASPAAWNTLQELDRAGRFPHYTLTRLDTDAVGCLVRDLLSEDDRALTERLAWESEGVPLYLIETLKVWRDEGHLRRDERGTWRWRGDVPAALPSHLGESIIDHRLSHLSPTATEVLGAAAVIGVQVDLDLLTGVCDGPASDLTTPDLYLLANDELLRLGFLVEAEADYRFSHGRVRQVVYHRLPRRERQRLHHRVAQTLEELSPERYELLAHHFVAAGERQPAIHYLARAADRARGIFAYHTALACYDHLLELLTYPEDRSARYGVLRDRAETLGCVGNREAQGGDLAEMLRLAQALSDDTRLACALHLRSEWRRLQGRYRSAKEDALAALEIYRRLRDTSGQAAMLTQLGRNILYTDDCFQAAAHFQEALPIHEAANDLKGQIDCLMGLAYTAQYKGDLSLSLTHCRRSLALAQAAGDHHLINYTLSSVGLGYVDLGDMDTAETYLRQALQLAETSGERRRQAIAHVRLAHVELNRDRFGIAQTHLQTALETLRDVQDVSWEAYTLSLLGELELLQDDPVAAREHQESAHQLRSELGEYDDAALGLSYLARAEVALGDETVAWRHSQEVIAKAEAEWSGAERPPEIYYNHFCVAESTRHWAAARAALEAAARIVDERAERIGDPVWQKKYRTGLMANRAIAEAVACQPPPGRLRVCLARAGTPAHRRPTAAETVTVTWTIDAGEGDAALAGREGKVALRRHRLLRLLAEAESAGALPTVADLAGGLDVSPRTVRADLIALRGQGHDAYTRGHRA